MEDEDASETMSSKLTIKSTKLDHIPLLKVDLCNRKGDIVKTNLDLDNVDGVVNGSLLIEGTSELY